MSYVFVVDTEHRPLDPVHPGHARRLLKQGAAAVWRRYPFTLILKRAVPDAAPQPLRLKIDPGSRTTGLALVTEPAPERALDMAPVAGTAGTGWTTESAGSAGRVVWAGELTHRGGAVHDGLVARAAHRRSRRQRHTRYRPPRFENRRRSDDWLPPSRDAAAVNVTRWALFQRLRATGLPLETGTGGRTKWNRTRRGLPKTHWLDAACVGASTPERLVVEGVRPLVITATGHGNRQMCGTDQYGFPIRHRTRHKRHFGFQTGDLVRAVVPLSFKTAGTHVGRVLVRASGSFDVRVASERDGDGAVRGGVWRASALAMCMCWCGATGIPTRGRQREADRGNRGDREGAHEAVEGGALLPGLKAWGFPRRIL